MTTIFEQNPKVRPITTRRLPAPDHLTSTEPRLLAEAVQAAVHRVDENTLKPVARHVDGQALRPKVLLALLSFCYARQTYGSAEVVDRLRHDANIRQFSPNVFPDARSLCRFRRENRELLHRCLTATLRFLAERKVAAGVVTKVNEAQLAEEANRRIITAMFMDSLELEPEAPSDAPVDLCYLFAKGRALAH